MLALAQQVVGQSGVQRADVGTWTLYAAPDLEFAPLSFVSMRVPGKNALPVRDARQTLLELALVSLLLAVGLCLALVRRTLLPLRRLMDATRRLAAGNFTQAIRVERADELGRLALSFNDMARRLDGQIQSLKAISAIDQELLGHPDIEHIVARTLPVIGALASDCAVAVARLSGDAAPSEGVPTWRWRAGVIEQLSLAIGEDEWQGWSLLRSDVQLPADAAAGSRLAAALFEGQSQDCRLIPVRGRNASITLIALGPVRLELPDPEQLAQIREIAKRLGLAFDAAAHEPVGLEDAQAGARRWLRETSEGASRAAARASGLEADLRAAIEGGEIQAHFQPRVRLEDGRVIGAEALARWPRRSQGLVAPERFIALAEQIGMIGDLGQSMLTQAVVRLGEWQRRGLPVRRVSVNVSTQQLREGSIAAQFVRIVQAAGLRAAEIELEIRQSALLPEARQVRGTLEQLRRAGFRIALDDFGTGSASLTDLRDVPIDVLKIDRRFIKDIDTSNGARASAIAIISLAQSLGIGLVAEGVETLEQENMLRAWGCHEAQGFLYARALSAPAFERYALTRPQRQAELGQTVEASVSF
jgi:EAL domain-containing protein (putative c-di-GMP-specific phosphodiesterase class I)/HAMP domain-containing protein